MSKNLFLLVSLALTLLLILSLEGLPEENYTLPKDPLKGQELFVNKGCIKCHSIQGVGGKIGPDLGKGGFNRSLIQIAGIMWNHSPKMSEKMRELKIPRPKFEVAEMADLVGRGRSDSHLRSTVFFFADPRTEGGRFIGSTSQGKKLQRRFGQEG